MDPGPSTSGRSRSSSPERRTRKSLQKFVSQLSSVSTDAKSPPLPPRLRIIPRLWLAFGNPELLKDEETSVEALVAKLLQSAYVEPHSKIKKKAEQLVKNSGMTVDKAVEGVHATWNWRHGPLHVAAKAGNLKACKMLINKFDLNVNRAGTDGATPLHYAVQGRVEVPGSARVVKLLLRNHADPNLSSCTGVAPIHIAADQENYEVAKLLLDSKANVEPLWDYKTPLYIAASHGNERMMRLLLQHGAKPNGCGSYTPLKAAVLSHSKVAVELLIEAGARVNVGYPDTPLIAAATAGLTDIIKCLLKAGADANITDLIGRTAIEAAAIHMKRECVEVLFPVTNRLARVAHWSIDGVIQHAIANLSPQVPHMLDEAEGGAKLSKEDYEHALFLYNMHMLHSDGVSDFEAEGDAKFSEKDYAHALFLYNMAIVINPDDSALYAKRSLCFLRTDAKDKALEDAQTYKNMHIDLPEYAQGAAPLDLVMVFGRLNLDGSKPADTAFGEDHP